MDVRGESASLAFQPTIIVLKWGVSAETPMQKHAQQL